MQLNKSFKLKLCANLIAITLTVVAIEQSVAQTPKPPILDGATVDCEAIHIRCAGTNQEYTSIQAALDVAIAGDRVLIRGGVYSHPSGSNRIFLTVNNSGMQGSPITIEPYPEESVEIRGWGFSDDGSLPSNDGEVLMVVNGDHVVVRNIEFSNSTRAALYVNGDYGNFEDLVIHDHWLGGIVVGRDPADDNDVTNNMFRWIEIFRIRHGTGWIMMPQGGELTRCDHNTIEYSLSYLNGYEPNGEKVDIIPGDPAGGGNSDGFGLGKECADSAPVGSNLCTNFSARFNIAWQNADDGVDMSPGNGAWIEGNIAFNNGPEGNRGFKILRHVYSDSFVFIGNVALANFSRGFEPRSQSSLEMYHNTTLHSPAHGLIINVTSPTSSSVKVINNLSYYNGNNDVIPSQATITNNHLNSASTAPDIGNPAFEHPNTSLPNSNTREKWRFMFDQFRSALSPLPNSPLIDGGEIIPAIHCSTADDDLDAPMDPSESSCRHWLGLAPDIGAFETI